MLQPVLISAAKADLRLEGLGAPADLDALAPGAGPWEVELGFGKGKYLRQEATARPESRFLGIEVASKYYRLLAGRARRRGLGNLVVMRGEALYLLSTSLPTGFAEAVHVYFPDPWPKSKHHKRRLFDPERVDLVLGLLRPGGRLFFATDFLDYGETVKSILAGHPDLELRAVDGPWPGGARTNYEAKYVEEGRPILRMVATLRPEARPPYFHPAGREGVLAAVAVRPEG
jgi:tRNA (guanine-N7-)-methyltransferase